MSRRRKEEPLNNGALYSYKATYLIAIAVFSMLFYQWQLHKNTTLSELNAEQNSNIAQWIQPESINNLFPAAMHNNSWHFDYKAIELILQEIKYSDANEIIINSHLADILKNASNSIDKNISQNDLERLAFLIKKGTTKPAGEKISTLVINYYRYSNHDDSNTVVNQNLDQQKALQRQYFGRTIAQQLFSNRNSIRAYLDKRHTIQTNKELDQQQKKSALILLEKAFKSTLTNIDKTPR